MTNIAIIPARGGSKRIERKNIIKFRGRPMIGWTIDAALNSGIFDSVLVSTDDAEIAEISRREGADVPFLRQGHADDLSPVSEATLTALSASEEHYKKKFHTVMQLMPNCPLRDSQDITSAWEHFRSGNHNFQISAFEFGWMNPWWAASINEDGQPNWIFPNARLSRSQDLKPLYCPTGAIWIANTDALKAHETFYGPGNVFFPMPWDKAIDIDEWKDFNMAKALSKIR